MDYVSVQIPAAVYVELYSVHGEETNQEIAAALGRMAGHVPAKTGPASARPGKDTITGQVWEIADQLEAETGEATREAVVKACIAQDINMNTASTQYSHWKKENR